MKTRRVKTNRAYSATKQTVLVAAIIALALLGSRPGAGQQKPKPQEQVLYSFQDNGQDGIQPEASLIFDNAGNLYGTTYLGGSGGDGSVFELSPNSGGGWSEKILYNFQFNSAQGTIPSSGLVFDKGGNLYGTTEQGGTGDCGFEMACGTVFELAPQPDGSWSETVLYSFQSTPDGAFPSGNLVFDNGGNLYGTTASGGNPSCDSYGCGTVFELSPQFSGWAEAVIYDFQGSPDGENPDAGVIFDAAGNLYGTTVGGGANSNQQCVSDSACGTVFELTPKVGGGWNETVLHSLSFAEGSNPESGLIFDKSGNLYGTTSLGGPGACPSGDLIGCGTVFELSPSSGGGWSATVLHSFQANGKDGRHPRTALVLDHAGVLYGTTYTGGRFNCSSSDIIGCGTVFELSPHSNGNWTEKIFSFNGKDGQRPFGNLIFDTGGTLYGTTEFGGTGGCKGEFGYVAGCGTVFEITR